MLSARIKKVVFFLIVLCLVGQGLIIHDQGEPYPALWAPGFGSNGPMTTYTKPNFTFVFEDGERVCISTSALLSPFPEGTWGQLSECFAPIPPDDSRPKRKLHTLFPGYKLASYNRTRYKAEIMKWAKTRAAAVLHRNDLQQFQVDWITYTFPDGDETEGRGRYRVETYDAQ